MTLRKKVVVVGATMAAGLLAYAAATVLGPNDNIATTRISGAGAGAVTPSSSCIGTMPQPQGQCWQVICDGDAWDQAPKAAGIICDDGNSGTSSDVCDGSGNCIGVPGVPGPITGPSSAPTGQLTLSWTAGAYTAGFPPTYELNEQVASTSTWTLIYRGSALQYSPQEGSGSRAYTVRACSSAGCGGYTATKTVTESCACTPATCQDLGRNCGTISDGCGNQLNCGSCTVGTCGGAGEANVCAGCTPTTCAAQGKNCGTISDGCGGQLTCGTCTGHAYCGGGGVTNVCGGCAPTTCADLGNPCGTFDNGCNGTIACGTTGASCDDGNACTVNDVCSSPGVCSGSPKCTPTTTSTCTYGGPCSETGTGTTTTTTYTCTTSTGACTAAGSSSSSFTCTRNTDYASCKYGTGLGYCLNGSCKPGG